MPLIGRGPLVRAVTVLLGAVLVLGGCSADESPPSPEPAPTPSATPPEPPEAAPLKVGITHVAGRIPRRARKANRARIARLVGSYVDGAFLGDFPRTSYAGAWDGFTRAAKRRARADRGILTHADRGARIAAVHPVRQEVRVQALAPQGRIVGGTARVRLVLRVTHTDDTVQRVRIAGRLLLTRGPDRRLKIFGYDLRRSAGPLRTPGGGA